jgi:DNA-binding NarL/FixJ family response regulator
MASWLTLRAAVLDLDGEERAWVDEVHAEARALLDDGLGTFTYTYRIGPGSTIRLGAVAGRETAPAFWRALSLWGGENERALARIYETRAGSFADAVRAAGRVGAALSEPFRRFEPHGVGDVLTVVGHDSNGFGVFLTVPRARSFEPGAEERRAFERLAVQLAAAARLREHRRRTRSVHLSASELRVARLLIEGASDKYIAGELGVAVSTVSTFARRVRRKLGCRPGQEALLLHPTTRSNLRRRLALFDRLTSSECDVASELLVGSSYAEIAERRGVSMRTVASQCGAVFRKCGVSGRRELASTLLGG